MNESTLILETYPLFSKVFMLPNFSQLIMKHYLCNDKLMIINVIKDFFNTYWLKHFKNLDLGIKNIHDVNIYYIAYMNIDFSLDFIVDQNLIELFHYKHNEEYIKNYNTINLYNSSYNTYLNAYEIAQRIYINFYNNQNHIKSNHICFFIEYLLKNKIEYYTNNNTFEKFLIEHPYEEFYKKYRNFNV